MARAAVPRVGEGPLRRPSPQPPSKDLLLRLPLGYMPTKRMQWATVTLQQNISVSEWDAHR